jgi:hypothetical protein
MHALGLGSTVEFLRIAAKEQERSIGRLVLMNEVKVCQQGLGAGV